MYLGIPKLCFIFINTYVYKPVGIKVYNESKQIDIIKIYKKLNLKIIKL